MSTNVAGEKRYEQVFGDTFARYSEREMVEFIEPFKIRFECNKLDARKLFAGKKCFDAGCGNGRGTLFMLMHGAAHVTGYDFSHTNVSSTRRFAEAFGYGNVDCRQGSLEDILFPDEAFDVVWCNGVIMHTEKPNGCLREISRILKVGGNAWLYIYGSGGVYWRTIYHLRDLLRGIYIPECIAALDLMRYENRYIAEFIDDWYATYLRSYTDADLSARLVELGFEAPQLLKYGMDYDTSHRINVFGGDESRLMGEGDLRYLLTKAGRTEDKAGRLIPEGEYGSSYSWPAQIADAIDPLFERAKKEIEKDWMRVAFAAHIQRELRLIITRPQPFALSEFTGLIENHLGNVRQIKNI